jgi:hypothetical protein
MQAKPIFLGACALVSAAGAISGAAINASPIQRGGIGMNEITRATIDFASDDSLSDQVALPDHYAIKTPEGRFDVPELSTRGIYAQRRFAWREARYDAPPQSAFADDRQDDADGPLAREWQAEAAAAEVPDNTTAQAAEANVPQQGQARLIDVDLALADR